MSNINKKINNTIAFGIVACFLILSFSAMADESTINQNTTSTVTSNGVNETTVKSAPQAPYLRM
jgi:hypothetical protein